MNVNWQNLLNQALEVAVPLLITFLVAKLLPKLSSTTQAGIDWVKKQSATVKNEWARTILNRVIGLVGNHVLAFEQTFIEDMKDKVKQGRISPADVPAILKEEKEKLLQQLKAELTAQHLWSDLKLIVTGENGDDNLVLKFIGTILESQVAQLPASGLQTPKVQNGIMTPAAVDMAPPVVPQQAAG